MLKTKIYQEKTTLMRTFYAFTDIIRIKKTIDKDKSNKVIDTIINYITQQIPGSDINTLRNLNNQVTALLKIRDSLQNPTKENIDNMLFYREHLQNLIEEESKLL